MIGYKDIVIHYNDHDKKISNKQKRTSDQLKQKELAQVFDKNSPFYKSDNNSDCYFDKSENEYIKLNNNFFKHINDDLNTYELWCSSDYYMLIKPKLAHLWGQNQYAFIGICRIWSYIIINCSQQRIHIRW